MRNDILVFAGQSHPELAQAICDELDQPLGRAETVRFSNDNLLVRLLENVREADCYVVQTSTAPVHDHLFEMLIFIDALRRASAKRVTAVMPYFPYVRSDKKDQPRISITARLVADMLEAAGVDRVLTMDLHAPQIQGFFKVPVDQLQAHPILVADIKARHDLSNAVMVATDAGGAKSAGRYANALHLDLAIVDKRRFGNDEKPRAEHLIGEVEGRVAIVIDDEIASGGTLAQAVEFVRRQGATKIITGATHAVLTKNAPALLQAAPLDEVLLTNSIPIPLHKRFPKLRELTVAPLFAQAIRRIHDGDSVSDLF
ncbi:MAG: ribose-phosphate pyrophosphokinase [Bradymonadia bacterium]|jgi:ribose-phosphate pyrophosphokinase